MPNETFFNLPDEKRSKLLEILLEEFAENDYKNVSIGRVVERAGIAKGSFYQYFADKQDCYLYLIQLAMEEKTRFLRQNPPAQHADLFSRLRWLMDAGTRFEFSNPRLARIGYKAIFDDVPLPDETKQLIRDGSYRYFRELVQAEIAAGTLKPHIDADIAAFLLNAAFTDLGQHLLERFRISPERLLTEGAETFGQQELRQAIDQLIAMLEYGLKKD